eukprot:symbB.v1.2.026626.t1/scaffold2678.1/size73170/1
MTCPHVKSLATALLSHGCKVGLACYQRCLSDILLKVLTEIQAARNAGGNSRRKSENLIVHHSRDTPEKQWDVLGLRWVHPGGRTESSLI